MVYTPSGVVMSVTSSCKMLNFVIYCVLFLALNAVNGDVSTKLDFGDDGDILTASRSNTTSSVDDDVEVKHTIVVSTKLKNYNNNRALQGNNDEVKSLTYPFNFGPASPKPDSGEVPVYRGMKAVDTTQIRTPDTRYKQKNYPDSVLISRNIRDDYDVFPNTVINPAQWRPSSYFNNINWSGAEPNRNFLRRVDENSNYNKYQKFSNDAVKEFYCKKCRELAAQNGCVQQRSTPWIYRTTTQKIKIDGKITKLN